LHGVGSAAPEIEATRTRIAVAATPELDAIAAQRERLLVVQNSGGAPLAWTASAYQGQIGARPPGLTGGPGAAALAEPGERVPPPRIPQVKGSVGPGVGALGNGGARPVRHPPVRPRPPRGPPGPWAAGAA